ncbi:MAG TPA: TonB family protein [Allosphingosinicella sp.]|nr:TonB family protein [Allosphingosinicella sp.]
MKRFRIRAAAGLILLFGFASVAAAAVDPPVRARSAGTLATLFSDQDYPLDAVRNREQGAVAFRLTVGPDGRPAGCSITASSGSASLDSSTCRLLTERARFQPARDSGGKAVADSIDGRIIWRLPDDDVMGRSEAAMMLWGVCLIGEAAKLTLSDLSPDEIVRRSYAPCNALETLAAGERGEPLDVQRRQIVQAFEETVFKAREVLKAPRPIPSPVRR